MQLEKQDFIAALNDYSEEPGILPDELWQIYQSALYHANLREKSTIHLSELMVQPVITVHPDSLLSDVSRLILEKHISGLPVVENNILVGIITEGDLLAGVGVPARTPRTSLANKLLDAWRRPHQPSGSHVSKVRDVMTHPVVTAEPQDTLGQGLELMRKYRVTRLVIVDGKYYVVGIITRSDILRFTSADPNTTPQPPPVS